MTGDKIIPPLATVTNGPRSCRLTEDSLGWVLERWSDKGRSMALVYAARAGVMADVVRDVEHFLGVPLEEAVVLVHSVGCGVDHEETTRESGPEGGG